jgi:hypothetical protein
MNVRVLSRIQLWAGACLVAAFFLPWFSQSTFLGVIGLSGYQTSDAMRQHASEELRNRRVTMKFPSLPFVKHPSSSSQKMKAEKRINELRTTVVVSYLIYLVPLLGILCFVATLGGTAGFGRRFIYFLSGAIPLGIIAYLYLHENDDGHFFEEASIGLWLTAVGGLLLLITVVFFGRRSTTEEIGADKARVPASSDSGG